MGAAPKLSTQSIVARLDELPTLPTIVYELSRVINDPMSSTNKVEGLMEKDQSLTTKVLKLANSAYYAIPGGVSNLKRAIQFIGFDVINQLVLSASIIGALDTKRSGAIVGFEPPQFWRHSLGVAMASETIARVVGHAAPSDLFTCGLVHDMGKIALYIVAPEDFAACLDVARAQNLSLHEAELRMGGARHTQVGRELALKWRLPHAIEAAVAHHHQRDPALRGPLTADAQHIVDIVFLGNLLVHALRFGHSGHDKIEGVPKDLLNRLAIPEEKLKDVIARVRVSIANADAFLRILGE